MNGARNFLDATLGSLDLSLDLSRVRQAARLRPETTTMGVLLALLLLAVPIACLALLSLVAFLGVMAVAGALSIVAKWRNVVGCLIVNERRTQFFP